MLKVGIIGCGKIADAHLAELRRVPRCVVVGACDREPLMAQQLAERFSIQQTFTNPSELLKQCRPDVVHITTPPQGHFELGKLCLEHGAHVYIEKPFTINFREAKELLDYAEGVGRKVTVGHDLQFSHVTRRMRELVKGGYLGGAPVHMESYYCYDLSDPAYARALLADKHHWVRKLPGKLLHNIISHGVARISEFLDDPNPQVFAYGFVSPLLKSLGEKEIIDELRVTIGTRSGTTAYFTFSSQMAPQLNEFRLFGPKNGLILDEEHQTLIRCPGKRFKSYAERFIPPIEVAGQYLGNVATNLRTFLHNDFHMKAGMKCLIESFYGSIRDGSPVPISYREILLTSKIMDGIFEQVTPDREQEAKVEEAVVLSQAKVAR